MTSQHFADLSPEEEREWGEYVETWSGGAKVTPARLGSHERAVGWRNPGNGRCEMLRVRTKTDEERRSAVQHPDEPSFWVVERERAGARDVRDRVMRARG